MNIHSWLVKHGSFPKGQREQPYQEYFWNGRWHVGQREIRNRAVLMGFEPKVGDSVLDFGTQMGGFLQLALLAGATYVEGIEIDKDYVKCAQALLAPLTSSDQVQYIQQADISKKDVLLAARQRAPKQVDHLILTSLGKHIGGAPTVKLILDVFSNAKNIYFETNAVQDEHKDEEIVIEEAGGVCVGETNDRNRRRLWRITK